jgi:hypothetical protein
MVTEPTLVAMPWGTVVLLEGVPDPVRFLLLDALVTYSDSCTLPNLTPSCPYFVQTDAGPTCGEQCRDLIAESGAADRGLRDVRIRGLVLHGRGMPRSVASGSVLTTRQSASSPSVASHRASRGLAVCCLGSRQHSTGLQWTPMTLRIELCPCGPN